MPHIHFLTGLAIASLLKSFEINDLSLFLYLIGSIFPDIDFFAGLVYKKNHRLYFTHFPSFWFIFSLLFLVYISPIFWFFFGGFNHMIIDLIDWQVYILAPFKKRTFSILNLNYEKIFNNKSKIKIIKNYYRNNWILLSEITLIFISILLLIYCI